MQQQGVDAIMSLQLYNNICANSTGQWAYAPADCNLHHHANWAYALAI
jgi:hypothetical protein